MKFPSDHPTQWLTGMLAISGTLLLAFALWFDTAFVSTHLSADGILEAKTIGRIHALRVFSALAAIPVFYGLVLLLRGEGETAQQLILRLRMLPKKHPDLLCRSALSVAIIFCGLVHLSIVLDSWENARGAEYYNIARSLASGNGFSAIASNRWFWVDFVRDDSEYSDQYYLTAIEEPLYPLLLGTSFLVFGQSGELAVLLLQLFAWLATCLLVYALGRRVFGRITGLLAGTGLALWPYATILTIGYLGPAPFGGLLIAAIAYLTIQVSVERILLHDVLLGVLLGMATLTLAALQVFIPLAAVCTLFLRGWNQGRSWLSAFVIICVATATIAPWTLRNWDVFGEFVPVRTGVGLISHQGNPILAATYHPNLQACTDTLGPLWSAAGPREAIHQMRTDRKKETEIYRRSFDCIAEMAPENYEQFNEAQRDKFYLTKAMEFIKSEPLVFAELAAHKYLAVITGWKDWHALIGLLGLLGALLALRRPGGRVLAFMVLFFIGPYALGAPWGYRYRYPIEPLLLLLAAHCGVYAAQWIRSSVTRLRE